MHPLNGLTALTVGAEAHDKEVLVVKPDLQHFQGLVSRLVHITGDKRGSWHNSAPQKRVRGLSTER